jgi:hypothetical protein
MYSDHWAVKGQVLQDITVAVNGKMKGSLCTFTVQLVKGYTPAYCELEHFKQ